MQEPLTPFVYPDFTQEVGAARARQPRRCGGIGTTLLDSRQPGRRGSCMRPTRLPQVPHPLVPDSPTTCDRDPMIDRRTFLAGTGAVIVAAPLAAEAQQAAKIPRIGYLVTNLAAGPQLPKAFRQGLRDLGYVEGRNVVIEYRDAEGKPERLPA